MVTPSLLVLYSLLFSVSTPWSYALHMQETSWRYVDTHGPDHDRLVEGPLQEELLFKSWASLDRKDLLTFRPLRVPIPSKTASILFSYFPSFLKWSRNLASSRVHGSGPWYLGWTGRAKIRGRCGPHSDTHGSKSKSWVAQPQLPPSIRLAVL